MDCRGTVEIERVELSDDAELVAPLTFEQERANVSLVYINRFQCIAMASSCNSAGFHIRSERTPFDRVAGRRLEP
jgi:hypothetical protein